MPVFRINIIYANRKRIKGYHIIDGVELDTYYRHLLRFAQRPPVLIVKFDVVQLSEHSPEAKLLRENNLKRSKA